MNKNWNRWIFASASKFFSDKLTAEDVRILIEGQDRAKNLEDEYVEFRLTGPSVKQTTKRDWQLDITINILINVIRDQRDNHKIHRLSGIVAGTFEKCIPVYKYGDQAGIDNPAIKLGALYLEPVRDRDVEIINFGQITPDLRVLQTTVEGQYRMLLST